MYFIDSQDINLPQVDVNFLVEVSDVALGVAEDVLIPMVIRGGIYSSAVGILYLCGVWDEESKSSVVSSEANYTLQEDYNLFS
jgi:hypothetical protein